MKRELILSDEAVLDIEEAFLWYAKIERNLANRFEVELYSVFDDLHLYPDSFQKRYKNIRVRFLKKFPYGVHYSVRKNSIIVVGVFHVGKNPKNWFKRVK